MARATDRIVVVGGGAAGIIAAWRAASLGAPVVLFERNRKLGVKLLISGGGKCNITHAGSMEDLRTAFPKNEARFLRPAFHAFGNADIIRLLEAHGVSTHVRPDGRVFPRTGDADDVVRALAACLEEVRVQVILNTRVQGLLCEHGGVAAVAVEGAPTSASHIVIATGGVSYPKTGTTGDGITFARNAGHTIVPLRPSLAPLGLSPAVPREWRGISIEGGTLALFTGRRKVASWSGDILFSHEGLSGPAALELSRTAAQALEKETVSVRFDFFPSKTFGDLDDDLNALIHTQRGRMIASVLDSLLPNRLVPVLLRSLGIDPTKRGHILRRRERRDITALLKCWHIGDVASISIERGEVTAGGIRLSEVDSHTMRSRKAGGLYICGEVLDIAGPIGGYNLQAAFSTGFVAGESAGRDFLAQCQ